MTTGTAGDLDAQGYARKRGRDTDQVVGMLGSLGLGQLLPAA